MTGLLNQPQAVHPVCWCCGEKNPNTLITVLLAGFFADEVLPHLAPQPRPAGAAEVAGARPAAHQVVAPFSQVFLTADWAPHQTCTSMPPPDDRCLPIIRLLRALVCKQHRVPAVDLGLIEKHAEAVVFEVVVAADGLRCGSQKPQQKCVMCCRYAVYAKAGQA